MRVRLFESFPDLPDCCFDGGQPVPIANRRAHAGELTGHGIELGPAAANGRSSARFRHCIRELFRRSLCLILKVSCVTFSEAARSTSLQDKIDEQFHFRGERLSRSYFGLRLLASDGFPMRTAG